MEAAFQMPDLDVRAEEGLVLVAGRPVPMSAREIGVLAALVARAERTVSRRELYESVWGAPLREGDRSVDVYVHKVRAKLEEALPGSCLIHTHVGFGYRLQPERSHDFHDAVTGR
jgi:DNA-binding response OmpR family regulator